MKKQIKFRVHKAVFLDKKNGPEEHYFLNILNDYRAKSIVIKEVAHISNPETCDTIENSERPLPFTLLPGKQWETWVKAKDVEINGSDETFNFMMEYEKTHIIPSKRRKNVPSQGNVPDGN